MVLLLLPLSLVKRKSPFFEARALWFWPGRAVVPSTWFFPWMGGGNGKSSTHFVSGSSMVIKLGQDRQHQQQKKVEPFFRPSYFETPVECWTRRWQWWELVHSYRIPAKGLSHHWPEMDTSASLLCVPSPWPGQYGIGWYDGRALKSYEPEPLRLTQSSSNLSHTHNAPMTRGHFTSWILISLTSTHSHHFRNSRNMSNCRQQSTRSELQRELPNWDDGGHQP